MKNLVKCYVVFVVLFVASLSANAQQLVNTVSTTCVICGGRGGCNVCFGSGGTYNSYTGLYYPCTYCFGNNRCKACGGTGKTVIRIFKGVGGYYGIDQFGNYVSVPAGSGSEGTHQSSSSGGRIKCKSCNGSGRHGYCNGTGFVYGSTCGSCNNGKCPVCFGRGYVH